MEDRALAFIQRHLKSVWALELLLHFHNHPDRDWTKGRLIRELRASEAVVNEALAQLRSAGLISETSDRAFRYAPADRGIDELVATISAVYSARPVSVIKAISLSPSDKLKVLSDAFKIKDT
jgi:hypothetical protein